MFIMRALTDAGVFLDDRVAPVLEVLLRLAPYGHKLRIRLVLDMGDRLLEHIAGIGARQTLVGRHDEHELLAVLMPLQERMAEIPGICRNLIDHLGHLVRKRLVGSGSFLCAAQA